MILKNTVPPVDGRRVRVGVRAARAPRGSGPGGSSGARRRRYRNLSRRLSPWAFLAPALVVFAVFKFWPTIYGMFLSLFNVRPYLGNQWVGLQNFTTAVNDPQLQAATWHTLIDAVITVAVSMFAGFALALLLEGPALHLRLVRTAAFLPVVTAMVVVAELWDVVLYPGQFGSLNSILGAFGIPPQGFLSDAHQALGSVMLVQVWKSAPYDMVIFIAGLAGVDRELYDASDVDGASWWQRLWYVTIPALRPITTIVLTLGIIRGLRVFTEIFVMTNGGPAGATEVIVTFLYKAGIQFNKLGYASAISTMLLIATVILTCLNLWWRARKDRA